MFFVEPLGLFEQFEIDRWRCRHLKQQRSNPLHRAEVSCVDLKNPFELSDDAVTKLPIVLARSVRNVLDGESGREIQPGVQESEIGFFRALEQPGGLALV